MSIAEKLTTVAENVPKVYEAGQKSMVDESKIIEKTVSGTNVVMVDDVSEIPHDVGVRLKSDTITDFSGISVTRYGGNLFDCLTATRYENNYGRDNSIVVDRTENSMTVRKTTNDSYEFAMFALPDNLMGQTITVCAEWTSSGNNAGYIRVNWDTQFEGTNIIAGSTNSGVSASGVVPDKPSNATHLALLLYPANGSTGVIGDEICYKNIMVNIGDKTLKFEPYNTKTVQANADGTVDGIKSLCPVMTLYADVSGVELTVDYHKSWGKQEGQQDVLNALSNNGTRTEWQYAFRRSDFSGLAFPQSVKVTNSYYMFTYYAGKYLLGGFDFSGQNAHDLTHLCRYAEKLKEFPDMGILAQANYNGTWQGCYELETIELIRCNENTVFDASFSGCSKLKDVAFEGTIGQNISFGECGQLTKASIENIIAHLSDTASGKTITFKTTAINTAFGSTASNELLNLASTKLNWNFSFI